MTLAIGEILIREVQAGELPALHHVIERAFRGKTARAGWSHEGAVVPGRRIEMSVLEAILNDDHELLLGAFIENKPVGCVRITQKDESVCEIGLLTVDPDTQAMGLGDTLLTAAERKALDRFGASLTELSVIIQQPKLTEYYKRRGYQITGRTKPYPIQIDPPMEFAIFQKVL
ncbi:GNAT family N-acetyltransferase [Novosphingobium sp. KN65.2]|uniref:GNAT family N-acetyltransferase n=1 Tax=Novosphingobium sp. KN65.2 TaxID=1478134 RepID=UPI001E5AFFE9|nr:GNAT family N-acetyltransferase [Novosphingobium sp. KN65.2]